MRLNWRIGATVAITSAAMVVPNSATARLPKTFFGVNADGPVFSGDVNLARQLDSMVASGVESIRVVFGWDVAQPYPTWSDVPAGQRSQYVDAGGVPTSFAATDKVVGLAAERGLTVLPTILYAPSWDASRNPSGGFASPKTAAPYAAYLHALVQRYGTHGSFWRHRRSPTPIRMWQIWNEPNLSGYWPQPFASSYIRLLRAAHASIRRADPHAKIVLGALTNDAWHALQRIYRTPGARTLFDVIAVNGYTATPHSILRYLTYVRDTADRAGDQRKPLLATELSWPTAAGEPVHQSDWDTTPDRQAANITTLLPMLAAHQQPLRLAGFYYYTWMTEEDQPARDDFAYAGLLRYVHNGRIIAKPGLRAYRRAALTLQGCRRKRHTATRCA